MTKDAIYTGDTDRDIVKLDRASLEIVWKGKARGFSPIDELEEGLLLLDNGQRRWGRGGRS